ncbi:metallophosphoesterase family protein [Pseudonocardia sp. GCM10023141]|uniref:metallophosphoesterase family protein n=1 Tax=Pseudonocardia sp. GCM10023141 TaxID=3252653 RepID=UPI00361C4AEE
MPRSVAVLSDIHGVRPALDAVLAEPDVAGADLIVVTGDHAAGPQPVAVLDRLQSLGGRALLVRGNADRELVDIAGGAECAHEESVWAAAQLSAAHIALLAGLPHPVTLDVEGFGPVLFCHGTPRDDDEVVLVDSRMPRWAEVFQDVPDEVRTVVCGHTHMPFVRLVDRRLVINPGSIGMPYGRAGGHWALLHDGPVTLRRTVIDVDAACAAVVSGSTYPARQEWAEYYLRAAASDAEALAVFGPRDGRG